MPARSLISFFGSSLVSAYWNGAATYYRGLLKALHARGHQITFFEPDAFQRQQHRDLADIAYARSVVYPPSAEGVRSALRAAREADILVKASGVGIFDAYLEEAVLELRRPATQTVFWDVDAPATLDRLMANPDDPFHLLIPEYDSIFTYGGGPPVINAYLAHGARRCIPVYNGLDSDSHHPATPDPRFKGSLGFLGNRMPDREERVKEFFFRPLALLPEHRFVLGGSGWDRDLPAAPNLHRVGHVYTRDHNAFNASPLAVLNISRESMARYGFSPATRVFEAAGAGACLITDAWAGIEQFFEPGREILVGRDGQEIADILSALSNEMAREIGAAALRRVQAEHSYAQRARQVEQALALDS